MEYETERRRLAGMLPGAEIAPLGPSATAERAGRPEVGIIALVDDLDRPIPVLVERGGYAYEDQDDGVRSSRHRVLRRGSFRLVLTDDRAGYARALRASGPC